jgi:hypothetical protein
LLDRTSGPRADRRLGPGRRDVVGRLRSAYALRQDPKFEERVHQLGRISPEFREWWNERGVVGQRARERTITVPGLGPRSFRMLALNLADDGFTSAIVHVPID